MSCAVHDGICLYLGSVFSGNLFLRLKRANHDRCHRCIKHVLFVHGYVRAWPLEN